MPTASHPTIQSHLATIAELMAQPALYRAALLTDLAAQDAIRTDHELNPRTEHIERVIAASSRRLAVLDLIDSFDGRAVIHRSHDAGDAYCKEHAAALVKLLRDDLATRSSGKDRLLAGLGKRAATVLERLFGPSLTADETLALETERERLQGAADIARASVEHAAQMIRFFELEPDRPSFNTALSRVREINFATPA